MSRRPRASGPVLSRRHFLAASAVAAGGWACNQALSDEARAAAADPDKALVAITFDLEMSRNFPTWDQTQWDYAKGDLDEASKQYTVAACHRVKQRGGVLHSFVVGRVLEQENVDWLKTIAAQGHPIGNHTYDHIFVLATRPEEIQFRFQRAPWLIRGKSTAQAIRENIEQTTIALKQRVGVTVDGFRTPGGFDQGLAERPDIQKMVLELGFPWVSSKYPVIPMGKPGASPTPAVLDAVEAAQVHAQPFVYPSGLVEVPMNPVSDVVTFRSARWKLGDFQRAVERGLRWAIKNRAVYDFLAHPSCLGVVDPELKTIDMICDIVEQAGDRAKLVGLDAIAARAKSRRTS